MTGQDFNSQPREGGWKSLKVFQSSPQNFNSQPREVGLSGQIICFYWHCDFNSQPREGGWQPFYPLRYFAVIISTHSRAIAR
jgi:hypothetical protein